MGGCEARSTRRSGRDRFLEQALAIALEGASFINMYPRGTALETAEELNPGGGLDADAARLISVVTSCRMQKRPRK